MKSVRSFLIIAGGNFLYALTVKLFVLPSGLVTGGTTGLALALNHAAGISVARTVFVLNALLFLLGFFLLGKNFALTTLTSSVLYPLFLELLEQILGEISLSGDLMLCAVFSGLGIGLALGIVIREGASTGGMDIPPLVLEKYWHVPVSASLYALDFLILLLQLMYRPMENVLYGVFLVLLYTLVLDRVLIRGKSRIELKIVSPRHEEISRAILSQIDRGVTLLEGRGGYTNQPTQMVLSIISNRQLHRVEALVRSIDPECFMIVSRVSEVSGRGFSMKKSYQ